MKIKNVLIRGIPVEVHRDLKVLAAMEGITLQSLIVHVLTEFVKRERGEG